MWVRRGAPKSFAQRRPHLDDSLNSGFFRIHSQRAAEYTMGRSAKMMKRPTKSGQPRTLRLLAVLPVELTLTLFPRFSLYRERYSLP